MKVFFDTNILCFYFQKNKDDICPVVRSLMEDYACNLQTSSVCVQEFMHLCHLGKIWSDKKKHMAADATEVLPWLEEMGIKIVSVDKRHLDAYASLPMLDGHSDPFDRLIVAQAIVDKTPLVSSDHKFKLYEKHGLQLIFNKR